MPQMLKMAGRVADGVMLSDLPAALARTALDTANSAAAARGRTVPLWSGSFTAWHVYADESAARAEAKRWLLLRGLFRPWVLETFLEPAEVELVMTSQPAFAKAFREGSAEIEGIPAALADKLVDELTLTAALADIDRLVAELHEQQSAGLQSVSLRLYTDPAAGMRTIAERVLPALR